MINSHEISISQSIEKYFQVTSMLFFLELIEAEWRIYASVI